MQTQRHARRWVAVGIAVLIGLAGLAGLGAADDSTEEAPKQVAAEDLAWLAGTWRSESDGGIWEELWTAPRAGTLVAVTRWVRDDAPKLYELTAIETDGDGLRLRLRHFGPGLTASKSEANGPMTWQLARSSRRSVEFENAEAGFPQRIVYARAEDDTLTVRLEGLGDDAEQRVEFEFTRVP